MNTKNTQAASQINQDAVRQDVINKAVWRACDTFRGTVDASIYKDYVLTMLFVKYISDVWQDHYGYMLLSGEIVHREKLKILISV